MDSPYILHVHSPVVRQLGDFYSGWFLFYSVMNNLAVSVHGQVFVWVCAFVSLGEQPGVELLGNI